MTRHGRRLIKGLRRRRLEVAMGDEDHVEPAKSFGAEVGAFCVTCNVSLSMLTDEENKLSPQRNSKFHLCQGNDDASADGGKIPFT